MLIDEYEMRSVDKSSLAELLLATKKNDPKKYIAYQYDREEIEKSVIYKHLKNEITILRYLDHPNIVKYQDVKKTKKHFYVIMEFCNGRRLSLALAKYMEKTGKPFPEEIVQHFMKQIIDAFKYIHERDIVHRCITMDNIMLNYENEEDAKNFNLMKAQIKIIDFLFSCRLKKDGLHDSLQYLFLGNTMNTDPLIIKALKMPKKGNRGLGYNKSADIWSIGTVCYEMLIGHPVFNSEELGEFLSKIRKGTYSIPSTVSFEAISFINGMLQYDAKQRLTASQLSRHAFLNKDVNQFKKINLEKLSEIAKTGEFQMNARKDKDCTIWSIFNIKDETLLNSILGVECVKPIDKKEELELSKKKEIKSSVRVPTSGIPDNPKDEKISGMSEEDFNLMKNNSINTGATNPFIGSTIDL